MLIWLTVFFTAPAIILKWCGDSPRCPPIKESCTWHRRGPGVEADLGFALSEHHDASSLPQREDGVTVRGVAVAGPSFIPPVQRIHRTLFETAARRGIRQERARGVFRQRRGREMVLDAGWELSAIAASPQKAAAVSRPLSTGTTQRRPAGEMSPRRVRGNLAARRRHGPSGAARENRLHNRLRGSQRAEWHQTPGPMTVKQLSATLHDSGGTHKRPDGVPVGRGGVSASGYAYTGRGRFGPQCTPIGQLCGMSGRPSAEVVTEWLK